MNAILTSWWIIGPIAFAVGLVLGRLYFLSVLRSATLFAERRATWRTGALTALRILAAAVVLFAAARLGAAALIGVFAGFLAARALAVSKRQKVL